MANPLDFISGYLKNLIDKEWHQPRTIIIVSLLLVVALMFLFSTTSLQKITSIQWLIIGLAVAALLIFWKLSHRIPRAPTDTYGFIVAISSSDETQRSRIAEDFTAILRGLLTAGHNPYKFSLLEYPQYLAARIHAATSVEEVLKYLKVSRCRFIIHGTARVREIYGKKHHILDLNTLVMHSPIPQQVSDVFSQQIGELRWSSFAGH